MYSQSPLINPIQLPSSLQEDLLNSTMSLVREIFFSFAREHDPGYLDSTGIESPSDVEFTAWPSHFLALSVSRAALKQGDFTSPTYEYVYGAQPEEARGGKHLQGALRRIKDIRNTVSHSIRLPVVIIRDMLLDASRIAYSLQQDDNFTHLASALHHLNEIVDAIGARSEDTQHRRIPINLEQNLRRCMIGLRDSRTLHFKTQWFRTLLSPSQALADTNADQDGKSDPARETKEELKENLKTLKRNIGINDHNNQRAHSNLVRHIEEHLSQC